MQRLPTKGAQGISNTTRLQFSTMGVSLSPALYHHFRMKKGKSFFCHLERDCPVMRSIS